MQVDIKQDMQLRTCAVVKLKAASQGYIRQMSMA